MRENKRKMPKAIDILAFWAEKLIEENGKYWLDIFFEEDSSLNEKTAVCFACGCHVGTQRSHIKARDKGGSDSVENLHLLCNECHLESENIESKGVLYNDWFNSKNPLNSGSYLRIKNLATLKESMVRNYLYKIDNDLQLTQSEINEIDNRLFELAECYNNDIYDCNKDHTFTDILNLDRVMAKIHEYDSSNMKLRLSSGRELYLCFSFGD